MHDYNMLSIRFSEEGIGQNCCNGYHWDQKTKKCISKYRQSLRKEAANETF